MAAALDGAHTVSTMTWSPIFLAAMCAAAGVEAGYALSRVAGGVVGTPASGSWPWWARARTQALTVSFAFATLSVFIGWSAHLVPALILAAVSVPLAVVDVTHHRLPDVIVVPTYTGLAGVLVAGASVGTWGWPDVGRALVASTVVAAAFGAIWVVSPSAMGFGDVKLVAALTLTTGALSWGHVAVAVGSAFAFGGLWAGPQLLTGRRGHLPFGPALLTGTWTSLAVGAPAWAAYQHLVGWA